MADSNDTSKLQPVPWPFGGIDYFDTFADGNPMGSSNAAPVTQGAFNVRGIDMTTSRRRGSGRSGMTKYVQLQIGTGTPIQEIAAFIASKADPTVSSGQLVLNAIDVNTGDRGWDLLDSKAQPYAASRTLSSNVRLFCNCWDTSSPAGHFYQAGIDLVAGQFILQRWDSAGTFDWGIKFGQITNQLNFPKGICIAFTSAVMVAVGSGNGFFEVWYFNSSDGSSVESVNPILTSNPTLISGQGACGTITPSYNSLAFIASGGSSYLGICETGGLRVVNLATNATVRVVPSTATLTNTWRVVSDGTANFYYCHQYLTGSTYLNYINKISAAATVTHSVGVQASGVTGGADVAFNLAPADAPSTPVVWGVFANTTTAGDGILRLDANLGSVAAQNNPLGNTTTCAILALPSGGVMILQTPPATPNFLNIQSMTAGSPLTNGLLQNSYQDNPSGYPTATHLPQIFAAVNFSVAPANSSAYYNAYTYLAVAGGVVVEFTTDIGYAVPGGQLSSSAPVIFSAQQGDYLYFADGVSTLRYNSLSDRMETWTASAGALPIDDDNNYPRLICLWRNRIVQAGLIDDASNWFMSEVGDATNWDYSPDGGPFQTQAVAGNNSVAGEVGDVINTLIPYNDDLLIFGGNHTIWQMSGDPMANGQIDLISSITGMPFGKPWCIDPGESIYFVGSRGGVFQMSPGGQPVRISNKTIDAALEYLDYTKIIVRLAWDDLEQGLHLFLSPIAPATGVVHFWFDARNNAWWPDEFSSDVLNPLAICVLAGSIPSDRVTLMGGMDGYIRKFDSTAYNDDGSDIANNALLGPFYNVALTEVQLTLTTNSGPVTVQVQVGQDAQTAIAAAYTWSGTFSTAGRNRSQNPMVYGNCMYMNLIGTGQLGVEQVIVKMKPGSQARQRIF